MALYKGFIPNWLRLGPWNIIVSFYLFYREETVCFVYRIFFVCVKPFLKEQVFQKVTVDQFHALSKVIQMDNTHLKSTRLVGAFFVVSDNYVLDTNQFFMTYEQLKKMY